MAIQNWSDSIMVVELGDDPQFTDDMAALTHSLEEKPADAVLNFSTVGFINSSNIARLLKLRKTMIEHKRRLVLCDLNTQVWGVFLVMGLDKVFEFTNDVATALASIQLAGKRNGKK